jgi:2-phosphosulfolactate phosphatase
MPRIDVCFSPQMIHLYDLEGKIVVIVDILRATSCMTTAIAYGVGSIIPVAGIDECKILQQKGLLAAAERDGHKVDGFDLDNSPFSYMSENLKGKSIAVTTTNGTQAISMSVKADEIIIGSFLNLSTVASYIVKSKKEVIVLCAGWKGKVNLEDTLFAGALISKVKEWLTPVDDAPLMAEMMYEKSKQNLLQVVSTSSHVQRLKRLNIEKDIEFCLTHDAYQVLPVLKQGKLVGITF